MSKSINVPIVRCGRDICRIIFSKDKNDNGKYDIKLDFLKKLYSVSVYRLFNETPEIWDSNVTKNSNITYHHGKNKQPITIHLKNENNNPKYTSLVTEHIMPPNRNTLFPIPLLKIEIPDTAVMDSSIYISKKNIIH